MKTLNRAAPAYVPRKTKNERLARAAQWAIAVVVFVTALLYFWLPG